MADKAFLCGINDYATISDLRGCVNDTDAMRRLLVAEFGFDADNIRIKTDDEVTKSSVTKGWKWLLRNAKAGDRLVFHFSGHGSYTADVGGESGEADFRDELLCLYGMDWSDPSTYLLDDEIAGWTKQIPDGVRVTFVLDCCHSGNGTRLVRPAAARAAKASFESAASHSIDEVAEKRVGTKTAQLSRVSANQVRPATESQIGRQSVLARFALPPAEVEVAVNKAKKTRTFENLFQATRSRSADDEASMNHVLWSGCRDDQTSADAYIENKYCGAFTHHFCRAARDTKNGRKSDRVIESLRRTLRADGFSQVPQLEPSSTRSTVFGGGSDDREQADQEPGGEQNMAGSSEQWQQLISVMQQIADHLGVSRGPKAAGGSFASRAATRSLVYIHGICRHDSGYSDDWFSAMAPHLSPSVRAELRANRKEVLWSEHVTDLSRSLGSELDSVEMHQKQVILQAILEERMVREAGEQIAERALQRGSDGLADDAIPPGGMPRALFGIPGLDCIDDFVKYLSSDRIRQLVVAEATDVIRPLLERGDSLELISHSWGTVVTYEALHALSREGLRGNVHNWFTVGAALAIGYVARQLRPGGGQKPMIVDQWTNVDARGDGVGGSIKATGMQVDREFLRLAPFGCRSTLGLVSPACAHSSYFNEGNDAVNRGIFADMIERV